MFAHILSYILTAFYVYIIAVVVLVILTENRNPVKTLAWITVLTLLPLLGLILYYFCGRDLRGKKIFSRKATGKLYVRPANAISTQQITHAELSNGVKKSLRMLKHNARAVPYDHSLIEPLTECNTTFNRLLDDIASAKDHIHIEFYILADDTIGNRLRELLIAKAKEKVRIRIIYDHVGSYTLSDAYLYSLRNAGIYIEPFLPVGLRFGFSKINYRNHRKIVVIDGKIGYTGGVNIADRYLTGNKLGFWRDTMVRLEGSAVQGLQQAFLTDWYLTEGKLINAPKYYPTPTLFPDNNAIQIVTSGPDTDWPNILHGIICAITNAKDHIFIQSPYFVPPDSILTALETAALSGIDVRLMLPQKSDTPIVAAATRSYFMRLMRAGVHILNYQSNFLHSKTIVIDNDLSIVGSANMDMRSYEQNFEVAAFIYDIQTNQRLTEAFKHDMEDCQLLTKSVFRKRQWWKPLLESAARLFSPLM